MRPRLASVAGPLEGGTFEIAAVPFSIGRQSSSSLQIRHTTVSRQHCEIRGEAGALDLADHGSRHGTFVNGVPVKARRLEHGDLIGVGSSLFLFLELPSEAESAAGSAVTLEDGELLSGSTVTMPVGRSIAVTTGAESRAETLLHSLIDISRSLDSTRRVEPLARRLIRTVVEVTSADRAALQLLEEASGDADRSYVHGRDGRPGGTLRLSRTLVRQVVRDRVATLCGDVVTADRLAGSESLEAERIRSLICAPLVARERILGVLYADSRTEVSFTEDDLRFLTALADISAAAFSGALRIEALERENRRLQETELTHEMVGESAAMQKTYTFIARVAPTDATVLIRGESGTGKELVARALHANSERSRGPFVAINCATLSETLLESELFGHEKGAFTGATARTLGKLELAGSGTLFLDEVGELSPALQAKLLRVLESREFERVGGRHPIRVDVRVLAATNRDLEAAIEEGGFRRDLYYRLNVISVTLPPLRERREDVPLLINHFAARVSRKLHRQPMAFSTRAHRCLTSYDWPGNVRELANAIERAVVLCEGDSIRLEDLPEPVVEGQPGPDTSERTYHGALARAKRELVRRAVEEAGGNITRAAQQLDLHPNYLHRLLRKLGLRDR